MQRFIKAAEVWRLAPEAGLLEFGDGWTDGVPQFHVTSRAMCFGRAEGLPGQAWDEGHPVLLKQFEGTRFRRARAAREAGLHCAVAVPFFVHDRLTSVLVLFCGEPDGQSGAIELWRNDPRVTGDMLLVDGHYGALPDASGIAFEAASRDTFLPRGGGLPGLAWQRGAAVLIDDLAASPRFVRADEARAAGIERGLAIPCATTADDAWVLALLSTRGQPVASRVEVFAPEESGTSAGTAARPPTQLQRVLGHCETDGPLPAGVAVALDGGPVGDAFVNGMPTITADLAAAPCAICADAAAAGCLAMVAVPVICDGAVVEVVLLYL